MVNDLQQCVYKIVAGRWSIQLQITILLLWLIEADVFQLPQLHKHFTVSGNFKNEVKKTLFPPWFPTLTSAQRHILR
jgi:hypothetical protein